MKGCDKFLNGYTSPYQSGVSCCFKRMSWRPLQENVFVDPIHHVQLSCPPTLVPSLFLLRNWDWHVDSGDKFEVQKINETNHNAAYATVAPDATLPSADKKYRTRTTLRNSFLSWPLAATLRTDSVAPIVLAMHAAILLAVSCEICHSKGSTGTETFIWRKSIPNTAKEQRRTMRTSQRRDTILELHIAQW